MLKNGKLKRLIALGTWLTLVLIALMFLLRWRGKASSPGNDKKD